MRGRAARFLDDRAQLMKAVLDVIGRETIKICYFANQECLSAPDVISGKTLSFSNLPRGATQNGAPVANNGTSYQVGITVPDTSDLSFGNGASDSAYSIFGCFNSITLGAAQYIAAKSGGSIGVSEYEFFINVTTGTVELIQYDGSTGAIGPNVVTTPTISLNQWHTVVAVYDPSLGSGANAATGMTIYIDGVAAAVTRTQQAGYVAMEDQTSNVGLFCKATPNFYLQGLMSNVGIRSGALTAQQAAAYHQACKQFLGF